MPTRFAGARRADRRRQPVWILPIISSGFDPATRTSNPLPAGALHRLFPYLIPAMIDWTILAPAAFFAGMVDAVVGGGGLILDSRAARPVPQTAIPTCSAPTNCPASPAPARTVALCENRAYSLADRAAGHRRRLARRLGRCPGRLAATRNHAPAGRRDDDRGRHHTFMKKDFGQQVTRLIDGRDRWKGPLSAADRPLRRLLRPGHRQLPDLRLHPPVRHGFRAGLSQRQSHQLRHQPVGLSPSSPATARCCWRSA